MHGPPSDVPDPGDVLAQALDGDADWIRRRERFYERALGPLRQPGVYHWEDDNDPHIDVYVIRNGAGRPHETLVTGGMADRPLPGVPPGTSHPRRVELILRMPEARDWAATILREIADMAFRYAIPLTEGFLIRGSRTICPGTRLRHAILLGEEEPRLEGFLVDGEEVRFLRVCFLTEEELEYAETAGPDRLADLLARAGAAAVLEVGRAPVV